MKLLVGTGGWTYFRIPGVPSLRAYSKAFNFVEVNSTFYRMPPPRVAEAWRRSVPKDFEFSVRCNKAVTHKHNFKPTEEALESLDEAIVICKVLEADILHMLTPPNLKLSEETIRNVGDLFSATNTKDVRPAIEVRGQPHPKSLLRLMKDLNLIHCVDLSKDEEPAYDNTVLYSRLFGKGAHNVYQPTDGELVKIDERISRKEYDKVVVSFHFVKMYKDAARFKTYKETGRFPNVTKSFGLKSLEEVLQEDAKFPSTRDELIQSQGWKLIDLTRDKRNRVSEILESLPAKTYSCVEEVVQTLDLTVQK